MPKIPNATFIHELFEAMALKTPDKIAVKSEAEQISYQALNEKANQLAHYLHQWYDKKGKKLTPDTFIPIYLNRSIEMIIAILGILKAGAAYMPIDINIPGKRLQFMLSDTKSDIILTTSDLNEQISQAIDSNTGKNATTPVIELILLNDKPHEKHPVDKRKINLQPSHLAVLMYTSGTTGQPKGVQVTHQGIFNDIVSSQAMFHLTANDRVLQRTPYTFGASIWEILWPLTYGARLYLCKTDAHHDVDYLIEVINQNAITIVQFVPTMLQVFISHDSASSCSSLKQVFAGGEPLQASLIRNCVNNLPETELINTYGAAETQRSCYWQCTHHLDLTLPPIGEALPNVMLYILDSTLQPVPDGSTGELYVGGPGLARGYLNQPVLTKKSFIPNPFEPRERLYKTGDLVQRLSSGAIISKGRVDFQVKLRGMRVELSEIETTLSLLEGIQQTVVIVVHQKYSKQPYLVAYYTSKSPIENTLLTEHLQQYLPSYMLPRAFVHMDAMPLNTSGKIDRNALPAPKLVSPDPYQPPRNKLEKSMCRIWGEILDVEQIGIKDDFFRLGGHSILAIHAAQEMSKKLGLVVRVADIFNHPTIESFLAEIQSHSETLIPIPKQPINEPALLSFGQERLWFIEQYEQGTNAYQLPMVYHISPDANIDALKQALQTIVKRHAILRTTFLLQDDQTALQKINEKPLTIEEKTCTSKTLPDLMKKDMHKVFDLTREYPMRVVLYRQKEPNTPYTLLIIHHHISFDGWSADIFDRELRIGYDASSHNQPIPLKPLPIQYKDFAVWQREKVVNQEEKLLAYWLKKLADHTPTRLPTSHPDSALFDNKGTTISFDLSDEIFSGLNHMADRMGVTLYAILLTGFAILLSRYTYQNDLVIGTPASNREHPQLSNLIGFFVNTLVLRLQVNPDDPVENLVIDTHKTVLEAQQHQDIPFEQLVKEFKVTGDPSHNPFFHLMFNMQYSTFDDGGISQIKRVYKDVYFDVSRLDLELNVFVSENKIDFQITYATTLFKSEMINQFASHYKSVLSSMLDTSHRTISQYPVLSPEEYQKIVFDWNQTDAPYPSNKTVHKLFEEQVKKSPNNIALVFEGQKLTYQELNERANQLAHYLRSEYEKMHDESLKPDTLIAICLERSLEMVIAILAVLKAGGAYVPLDPEYPIERIQFQLDDTQAVFLLTDRRSGPWPNKKLVWPGARPTIVYLDKHPEQHTPKTNPKTITKSTDLAYIIYTSGTTGEPKGVMITHRNWVNVTYAAKLKYASLGKKEKIAQIASFIFDTSCLDIALSLLHGYELHIVSKEVRLDSTLLLPYLKHHRITTVDMPTILYHHMSSESLLNLTDLKTLIVGGEPLRVIHEHSGLKYCLINSYGPTETTVESLINTSQPGHHNATLENIGKPISNSKAYVLDKQNKPVPIGAIGELYIGGAGVARGYLNQHELTKERFIPNPFMSASDIAKTYDRLYKTGDLVRYLPDGNIQYIGRNDLQVKIRGYRIELGEIETQLAKCPDIHQAVVLPYQKENDATSPTRLVAYYVATKKLDEEVLRNQVSTLLPDYMIPNTFIALPKFPLTPNGKLDSKALPEPDFSSDEESYVAPRNQIEKTLCNIWSHVLSVDRVGIQDDFFRLGGDSIQCIQVTANLQRIGLMCAVRDIFDCRTIALLATRCRTKSVSNAEQGLLTGSFELLPIQAWFFEADFRNPNHWNQAFILRVPKLTEIAIDRFIQQLVAHHDMLRIQFKKTKSGYQQVYQSKITLPAVKLLNVSKMTEGDIDTILTDWKSHFDIENGPLWQVGYLTGYPDHHPRLFFALHHLIVDSVSWRILAEDMKRLYEHETLGDKTSSYRQWVQAIHAYPENHREEGKYWETVNDKIAVQNNGPTLTSKWYTSQACINKAVTHQLLHDSHRAYHTQINDLLLTALAYALSDTFGLESPGISLEGHGRESIDDKIDISRTLGWFTSIYPVCLEVKENLSNTIQHIKETLHTIPNKGVGYGAFKIHSPERFGDYPPITFNYLGQFDGTSGEMWQITHDLSVTQADDRIDVPQLLKMNGWIMEAKLTFSLESYTSQKVANQLAKRFETRLEEVVTHCVKQKTACYTPSDFEFVQLSKTLLDKCQSQDPNIEAIYPATSLQRGFIYHALSQPEDDAYRIQALVDYESAIQVDSYKKAWALAIETYPILRTYFNWDEDIVQITSRQGILRFTYHDVRKAQHKKDVIRKIQEEDRQAPFDLTKPTLLRLHLIQRNDNQFTLLQAAHHSIMDGWSGPILYNTVHRYYTSLLDGKKTNVVKDQTYFQTQTYIARHLDRVQQYWTKKIATIEHTNNLQPLCSQPCNLENRRTVAKQRSKTLTLPKDTYTALKQCSQSEGITMHSILQFAWHKVIQVYTQDKVTVIGTTISGRTLPIPGIEDSVGLYINTLPLVVNWRAQTTRKQLQLIDKAVVEANEYCFIDLASLQKDGCRLFQSMLIYEKYPDTSKEETAIQIHSQKLIEKFDYPFALGIQESKNNLTIEFNYDALLVNKQKIASLLQQLQQVLTQIPHAIDKPHHSISLLSQEQYQMIIYDWNKTELPYPRKKTIHQLFEEQVVKTPNNTALVFEGQKLTYQELNKRANQLAHYLRSEYEKTHEESLKPDTLIAICLERSLEMVIAILAVLKAGGAYVPLDPEYPIERIQFQLEDTQAAFLLTERRLSPWPNNKLVGPGARPTIIYLDKHPEQHTPKTNPKSTAKPTDLAYVIYTSGTTGKPKGVMVTHTNWVHITYATKVNCIDLGIQEKVAQVTSFVFDTSCLDISKSLLHGCELHILSQTARLDIDQLFSYLKDNNITTLEVPTTLYHQMNPELLTQLTTLKCLVVGGEKLGKIYESSGEHYTLRNSYGPSETTVDATAVACKPGNYAKAIRTIGKPLANVKLYILDNHQQPVPIGAIGELYIGGAGVAQGYLNQPELTSSCFITNPFATKGDETNGYSRLYKTGDLARYLPDGNIEYIGRNDFQVKIRGYRIELGEVEAVLSACPGVQQAIVLPYQRDNDGQAPTQLIGYYVGTETLAEKVLREHVSKTLPDYMVPFAFISLKKFPLTVTGKLDRKALPSPDFRSDESSYVAARNEQEQIFCDIFSAVLGVSRIGIHDDFFKLGGDSIQSIQASSRLRHEGIVCSVRDIFDYRTIAQLTQVSQEKVETTAEQGLLTGSFNLLPIQAWFFEQAYKKPNHWNQAFMLKVPSLSLDDLSSHLLTLTAHHDALRLRFKKTERGYEQVYQAKVEVSAVKVLDVSQLSEAEVQSTLTDWQAHFDIEKGPLWQVGYLTGYADKQPRLFFALHHLIVDAVSWRILAQDIKRLHDGEHLHDKSSSYRQWVNTVASYPEKHAEEKSYWEGVSHTFATENHYPSLGAAIFRSEARINKRATQQLLQNTNQAYHTQINDILLTALAYSLSDVFSHDAHEITLEGHGREVIDETIDTARTVGWFTSMFPVCLEVQSSLSASIKHIKETLHRIPNKGLGYGAFRAAAPNNFPKYPLITFNYLGQFDTDSDVWQVTGDLSGTQVDTENVKPQLLEMNGWLVAGELSFVLETHTSDIIATQISKAFEKRLLEIIKHCLTQTVSYYTPCDFETVQVSKTLLDKLQSDDANIEAIFPATSVQSGYIKHALAHPEDNAYRVQVLYDYDTALNVEAYKKAWSLAIKTYPILRTYFNWEEEMLQITTQTSNLSFKKHDIRGSENVEDGIRKIQEKERQKAFDLTSPTLLRLHLIQRGYQQYTLLNTHHHIIIDPWSRPILMNTVHRYYEMLCEGKEPHVEIDQAYHQTQAYIAKHYNKDQQYWKAQVATIKNVNDLTPLCTKPFVLNAKRTIPELYSQTLSISDHSYESLKQLSMDAGITMHSIVQFAWHKLIQLYTKDKFTIVGTVFSGRTLPIPNIENSVGLYINTLPLILNWESRNAREQLQLIDKTVIDANEHSFLNLASIDEDGHQLFQSLVMYENYPDLPTHETTLQAHVRDMIEKFNYPIGLSARHLETSLSIELHHDVSIIDEQKNTILLQQLEHILTQLADAIDKDHYTITLDIPKKLENASF